MTTNSKEKATNQDVIPLYCLVGEAICMIQHLEGALSVLITLKKHVKQPYRISKEDANAFLKKSRRLTLGEAVKLAKNTSLYSDILHRDLEVFLKERNWLIHKFLHDHLDDMHLPQERKKLFCRIKAISHEAISLQQAINKTIIEFSESVGMDMSSVRAYIEQHSINVKSSSLY